MAEARNIFSQRLEQLINDLRYSQVQIAKLTQSKKQSVNNWLHGRSYPEYLTLVQLADILEVSLDYLTGRSDSPKVHKPRKPEPPLEPEEC